MVRPAIRRGPQFNETMTTFGASWKQGQHVLVSGPTGSGKTVLARHIIEERLKRNGHVIVLVMKPQTDTTIDADYAGFTRWEKMRKPRPTERRILLWPDVSKLTIAERLTKQKKVFGHALDTIDRDGKWTVVIDEGLYTTDPQFLGMARTVAMMHAVGRSNNLSIVTLTQRPAHLPLILYGSASHAFVGHTNLDNDLKRLAELAPRQKLSELKDTIVSLHDRQFLWIAQRGTTEPRVVQVDK